MSFALRFEGVSLSFGSGESKVDVLNEMNYQLQKGQFHALMGRSGSGKSTCLNLAAGLLLPTSGRVWVGETEVSALDDDARTVLRRRSIGVIFQDFNLVPTLSLADNVSLPFVLDGRQPPKERIDELIRHFGLESMVRRLPHELSGGERQRVAIVRALALSPELLLGDEPTGCLDLNAGEGLCDLLREVNRDFGVSVLLVTHDPSVASRADEVHFLVRGKLVGKLAPEGNPEAVSRAFLESVAS